MKSTNKNKIASENTLTSEAVWNTFSADLKRYIFSKVKDQEMTNDILQEVFIKIHLNMDKLQKQESLKSWLFTITHNTIMSFFTKKENSQPIDNLPAEEAEAEETITAYSCLIPLINHLPEIYREPLLQSEIHGKKQAEVAAMMNMTLSTAKSRIQRGRKLLQQGFMDCCHYTLNDKGLLVGEHQDKKDCTLCNHS